MVVSDDVIVDGMLVIPKGTVLTGRVLDNVRPTRMGVRARVDVEVEPIEGMDSTPSRWASTRRPSPPTPM